MFIFLLRRVNYNILRRVNMPSQIAPTPIIRGPEAEKIYAEANRIHSIKSKDGAKKLASIFDKIIRNDFSYET